MTNSDTPDGAEAKFKLLVDAVLDYALYMLDPDGAITTWNSGAQKAKGYTADEIVGRHFSCFFTQEDRDSGLPERALRVDVNRRDHVRRLLFLLPISRFKTRRAGFYD